MTTDLFEWQILIFGIVVFLYGIVIGSFLNVCIYRIPLGESLSKQRSHCMSCGYQLRWYDLIPVFSYLFLGGKCRKCKEHISAQYPIVESLNGILYVLTFLVNGWSIDSAIYSLTVSALIVISVIGLRTFKIPKGVNIFILALGLIYLGLHLGDWVPVMIGSFAVSIVLFIVSCVNKQKIFTYALALMLGVTSIIIGYKKTIIAIICGLIIWLMANAIIKSKDKGYNKFSLETSFAIGLLFMVVLGGLIIK